MSAGERPCPSCRRQMKLSNFRKRWIEPSTEVGATSVLSVSSFAPYDLLLWLTHQMTPRAMGMLKIARIHTRAVTTEYTR